MEKGKINKQREPFSVRDKMFWDVQTARSLLGDKFRKSLSHEPDGLIFQPARDVNTRARNLLHLFSVILTKFICFFAAVHDGSIASRAKMEASPHELGRFQAENCQGIWHGVSIHHLSDNISFINFHFFSFSNPVLFRRKSVCYTSASWSHHSPKSKSHESFAIWTAKSSNASLRVISGCSCANERISPSRTAIIRRYVSAHLTHLTNQLIDVTHKICSLQPFVRASNVPLPKKFYTKPRNSCVSWTIQ